MYNRTPYNRTQYNRKARFVFEWTATANAESGSGGALLVMNMVAGDELIIDTEHMTVTLNGVNIVDRVSDSSVFFKLMSGVNDIIVEGGTTADIRILWKDRWL